MRSKGWIALAAAVMIAALWCGAAMAETWYDLWVGNVHVSSANKDNIPGITSGTAQYDPDTNTLVLNNVTGINGYYLDASMSKVAIR